MDKFYLCFSCAMHSTSRRDYLNAHMTYTIPNGWQEQMIVPSFLDKHHNKKLLKDGQHAWPEQGPNRKPGIGVHTTVDALATALPRAQLKVQASIRVLCVPHGSFTHGQTDAYISHYGYNIYASVPEVLVLQVRTNRQVLMENIENTSLFLHLHPVILILEWR